jgi:hypothetical protein
LPSVGAEGILKCPRQIAIVSTGLIFHLTQERQLLMSKSFGMLIVDEAHRARGKKVLGQDERDPNNLLTFLNDAAKRAKHVLLGTATPIQTDIADLWDLMKVLGKRASHVMGDGWSLWNDQAKAIPVITGQVKIQGHREAWDWFRNPIPPAKESEIVFGHLRTAIGMRDDQFICDLPYSQIPDDDDFVRPLFEDEVLAEKNGLGFFQRNNPVVRHVVIRRRKALEDAGLLPRIPVDIHPMRDQPLPGMFDGLGVRTSDAFDAAYTAAVKFTDAFSRRQKSAGLLKGLVLQRLCSSYASGISTVRKLLEGRRIDDEDLQLALGDDSTLVVDEERRHLQAILDHLGPLSTDPKLDVVLYFLLERRWLDLGCIVFSQYYDTSKWVGECLTHGLPGETVAVYAGAGKSGIFLDSEWRSVERDQIKKAVKEHQIRMVVATDAACEGLNLQTLGTLINVDLPWNPSRLEQRIGRIKRLGQRRDRVDMLNLVYHGTRDEKVYETLSERMRDRYDIFGMLPDVIEDDWIDDIEALDERLKEFTRRKKQANAFDLRYGADVDTSEERWELCERVLARHDVVERLSRGWTERESAPRRPTL